MTISISLREPIVKKAMDWFIEEYKSDPMSKTFYSIAGYYVVETDERWKKLFNSYITYWNHGSTYRLTFENEHDYTLFLLRWS